MATIELNAKELELFREIKNDPNLLETMLNYIRGQKKTKKQPPCQYTVEELRERLEKARKEVEDGVAVFTTQEEMERMYAP
jgi:hypothetical protein